MLIFSSKRKPTRHSRSFKKDIRSAEKHAKKALSSFKKMKKDLDISFYEAKREYPGRDKKNLSKRSRHFLSLLKDFSELDDFLNTFIGTSDISPKINSLRKKVIKNIRDGYFNSKYPFKSVYEVIFNVAKQAFEIQEIYESQSNIREALPETMRTFLPKNIIIEVDENGTISRITDRFENEYETLEVKIKRQHLLIKRYNQIVKKVKRDLKSPDEMIRLAALVTSIIMETGIRPGQKDSKTIKIENGNSIEVETFGATTLGPQHVSFVKDFARLEFVGKKGTVNIAQLSSSEAVRVLQSYVKSAEKGKSKYIFITSDGDRFKYTHLKTYFNNTVFKGLKITDFRKLKATETVLSLLYEEQQGLYERILSFADLAADELEKKIAEEVSDVINNAYLKAQRTLSHEDVDTTIGSYVNPEVILGFLSTGRVEQNIKSAILQGQKMLAFNPKVFLERALSGQKLVASSLKVASTSLLYLLNRLKKDMKEEGVSPNGFH